MGWSRFSPSGFGDNDFNSYDTIPKDRLVSRLCNLLWILTDHFYVFLLYIL